MFMEEAIRAGVSSYNVLGVPPPDVKPILRAAAAMFRHHQTARAELRDAEKRLREREIVDRAKAILIRERRMGEPDAYRWLRTRAMSTGRRIADIAQEVVTRGGGQIDQVAAPTTIQGGIFHTVRRRKPASASAKSRGVRTALVQTGL